jgi:hypothetical protein
MEIVLVGHMDFLREEPVLVTSWLTNFIFDQHHIMKTIYESLADHSGIRDLDRGLLPEFVRILETTTILTAMSVGTIPDEVTDQYTLGIVPFRPVSALVVCHHRFPLEAWSTG